MKLNQILPLVFIENIPSRNLCIYIINANAQANTVSLAFFSLALTGLKLSQQRPPV